MSTFELRGWYVSHDVKFADDVTTSVEPPAPETARRSGSGGGDMTGARLSDVGK